jgi:hypothetical protein
MAAAAGRRERKRSPLIAISIDVCVVLSEICFTEKKTFFFAVFERAKNFMSSIKSELLCCCRSSVSGEGKLRVYVPAVARPKRIVDEDEIRTHAGRAHWISSPTY